MEDQHTHDHYAFLANRFYESLMSDVVMLFDADCSNTIKQCGYIIPEHLIVNDEKIKNGVVNYANSLAFEPNLAYQQAFFSRAIDEKRNAINQIKEFIK